jgi:predicted NBD/HSP70 family sugar kinase
LKVSFRSAKTAVIAALLQNNQLSRLELSERAAVSPAAITEVTQGLLRLGLLLETPAPSADKRRGRPAVQLSFHASHSCFLGVSIGEEETRLAITDLRGEVLASDRGAPCGTPDDLAVSIRSSFSKVLRNAGIPRTRVRGAGIAVAGIVDADAGVCRYSAGLDWKDVPVAKIVAQTLRLPAWADNDANAVAMGDKIFGRAREYDNFSSIVLGSTIGSAHYVNGMLYRGHDGSAGEIGHITVNPNGSLCRCGRNGCLDTVAGGVALRHEAEIKGLSVSNMRDLEALARLGNANAIQLLRTAGMALGSAVATLVHLNNPQAVVFTDMEGFENGIFRTATRQAIENGILPRFLGSTEIIFGDAEADSLPRSAASIAAFNYLMTL